MSLLAHRGSSSRGSGRRSSVSGFFHQVSSVIRAVVGSSRSSSPGRSASIGVAGAAIVCMGLGYVLGNTFPWQQEASKGGLKVQAPRAGLAPGPIGEQEDMRPLSGAFFLTSSYRDVDGASGAAKSLRQAGIAKARVREFKKPGDATGAVVYGLVVYFDGPRERGVALTALQAVPAPDAAFDNFRKTAKVWPLEDIVR